MKVGFTLLMESSSVPESTDLKNHSLGRRGAIKKDDVLRSCTWCTRSHHKLIPSQVLKNLASALQLAADMFDLPKIGLRLRAFRVADLDDIMRMENDREVASLMVQHFTTPMGEKRKQSWKDGIENHAEMWCTVETMPQKSASNKNEEKCPEFVGFAALWPAGERGECIATLAIGLRKEFWGRGYGTEITRFMVGYGFQHLNMHRIALGVFQGNERAIAVYQKWYVRAADFYCRIKAHLHKLLYSGFMVEVNQRKSHWVDGGWQDVIIMGMLREDWITSGGM